MFICCFLFCSVGLYAQNPHGKDFKVDCASCHNPNGWEIVGDTFHFNHDTTNFPLLGQHQEVDCKACHISLVFRDASSDCISCHADIHQMSVGNDCARCHQEQSWLVDNIPEIHEENGFPLLGGHQGLSCVDCHQSETHLRFDRIGNDCISCHLTDFQNTTSPDHETGGFSMECIECHDPLAGDWSSENINHDFFPLVLGHDIADCNSCHITDNFSDAKHECISCHQMDYTNTADPNHTELNFSEDCASCHSLDPGWQPAQFSDHDDLYFPIYSGEHQGEWVNCVDCHNTGNYQEFSCIQCHTNPETDEDHSSVDGYIYENNACLACHPNGNVDDIFDHDGTNFPLTGVHLTTDCNACHTDGFVGTPTQCAACHTPDFMASINPNHAAINIPMDCATCHSTEPEWKPATFDIHDDYYELVGAHAVISNDCATCHNGDYNNTPNTCVGCHQADYDATSDPNHAAAMFNTECIVCHSELAWIPATYGHDALYFPIYSGKHEGEWMECIDCHINPDNFAEFSCINCHFNPETDDEHTNVGGYTYEDNACLVCHPTGDADMPFDHNNTGFPLTGSHLDLDCILCHANGYAGTPTACSACHTVDFMESVNPPHSQLNIPTDCAACHTTEPDWMPASFDIHDDYYELNGAHAAIANDCAACHNGDYTTTPNTCIGCHQQDFDMTDEPDHVEAGFSTNCIDCHTESVWSPATFEHDFYPLQGAHTPLDCISCHADGYVNTPNTCLGCHQQDFDNTMNPNHATAHFGTECLDCHNESAWTPATFDHDVQYFPIYTGKHDGEWSDCLDCHTNPDNFAEFTCITCHMNPETDNEHVGVGGYAYQSNACLACHPTGDADVAFNHDETDFPLTGEHLTTDCLECHANGFEGTPTECLACHQMDFNMSLNPSHTTLNIPTDCASCHTTEPDWLPATFDIHDNYYELVGAHAGVANDCATCHNGDYNNTPNTCVGCHLDDFNATTDPNHQVSNFSTECIDCHTESAWTPAMIDHNFYPLNGAHEPLDCIACHADGYTGTPTTCVGCHLNDYDETSNPNHVTAMFSTTCLDCHNELAWIPSTFDHDNQYFPIYSGVHDGEWNECIDCHINTNNYAEFTCIGCHMNPETDDEHDGVGGYVYEDNACLVCHPTGDADDAIDHDNTAFPLTGVHVDLACLECHASGYAGTPTECVACHQTNFDGSSNPDHNNLNISTDCATCHTTEPDWMPATFDIHDNYYELVGAHAIIADNCVDCHNGDYNNTPNTCIGCHQTDYNGVTNPDHAAANFPTDCILCHDETVWTPATFDHYAFYPLTGEHAAITDCNDCHNGDYVNTPNTCVACHQTNYDQSTNPNHGTLAIPTDCASCHTTDPDWMPATFDIHDNYYELVGAHAAIADNCVECHNGDYNNTPNTCIGCHQADYNGSSNPDHAAANFPTDCILCHDETAWTPSTFDHDAFYPLTGEHAAITDCNDCHNGDYVNTPTTCVGCHQTNYDQSTNPNHGTLAIPTDCASCHTTDPDWMPATFDIHDNYYELVGAHAAIADNCVECHNGDYNNTPNTCIGCHQSDYDGTTNPDHAAVNFPTDCILCHDETAWTPSTFDHDAFYPLTGEHAAITDCNDCHNGDYVNTPNTCVGCHQANYDQSTNPDHGALSIPNDCASCHTTDPDWMPATFDIHDNYYELVGAHATIADNCVECHNGDYNNTPNTCIGCHQSDYDGADNPDHAAANFPTECLSCHTEIAWTPSTFDHDGQYFPIYSGRHEDEWNECIDCHINASDFSIFSCIDCHEHDDQNEVDDDHEDVSGYIYESNACFNCHPQGED